MRTGPVLDGSPSGNESAFSGQFYVRQRCPTLVSFRPASASHRTSFARKAGLPDARRLESVRSVFPLRKMQAAQLGSRQTLWHLTQSRRLKSTLRNQKVVPPATYREPATIRIDNFRVAIVSSRRQRIERAEDNFPIARHPPRAGVVARGYIILRFAGPKAHY
jgi:hypothetical protein